MTKTETGITVVVAVVVALMGFALGKATPTFSIFGQTIPACSTAK